MPVPAASEPPPRPKRHGLKLVKTDTSLDDLIPKGKRKAPEELEDLSSELEVELSDNDLEDVDDELRPVRLETEFARLQAADAKKEKRKPVMELGDEDILEEVEDAPVMKRDVVVRKVKSQKPSTERISAVRQEKATRRAMQEETLDRELASADRELGRDLAFQEKAKAYREVAHKEGETIMEARARGYDQFIARDAEGGFLGFRSDVKEIPVDFAFKGVAEGFRHLTEEVEATKAMSGDMAQRRLAQIQEETMLWSQQYEEAERMFSFRNMKDVMDEDDGISVTYEDGDISEEVKPDMVVANVFYKEPKAPVEANVERALTTEDRLEGKKKMLEAEIAMIDSELDPSKLDVRGRRIREDMAAANAKIETLQSEMKMMKKMDPETRAKITEDIKEQEGHIVILGKELDTWQDDEDRPKEIRATRKALLEKSHALKEELRQVNVLLEEGEDVDLSELEDATEDESEASGVKASPTASQKPKGKSKAA